MASLFTNQEHPSHSPSGLNATKAIHQAFDGHLLNVPATPIETTGSESVQVKSMVAHILALSGGGGGGGNGGGGSSIDRTFNSKYSVHCDNRMAVFGYGSNSIEQIRTMCENPNLQSVRAKLNGFVVCFAGQSLNHQNCAVATIVPMVNHTVLGFIVYMTQSEIEKLDFYEGVDSTNSLQSMTFYEGIDAATSCRRVFLPCCSERIENVVPAWVYVQNRTQWVSSGAQGGKPSPQYLTSMIKNIEQHWYQPDDAPTTIIVRRADTGKIVNIFESFLNHQIEQFNPTTVQGAWQQCSLFQEGRVNEQQHQQHQQQSYHLCGGAQYPDDDY
jgi:hypothetical protein